MAGLDWLTARPIAHRGLHGAGVIENTATAFAAAIAGRYGIECDLQISADGEAMVHHDDALGRLTDGRGQIADMDAAALKAIRFKATDDRMLTLRDLCDLVAGRAALALELKSRFDGDHRLVARTAKVLNDYSGPAAVMSFDPDMLATFRTVAPALTRGIVAEGHYDHPDWAAVTPRQKFVLAHLLHGRRTRPDFIAYAAKDLPAVAPLVARTVFGLPILAWTIRSSEDGKRARRYADQIIFEGFRP